MDEKNRFFNAIIAWQRRPLDRHERLVFVPVCCGQVDCARRQLTSCFLPHFLETVTGEKTGTWLVEEDLPLYNDKLSASLALSLSCFFSYWGESIRHCGDGGVGVVWASRPFLPTFFPSLSLPLDFSTYDVPLSSQVLNDMKKGLHSDGELKCTIANCIVINMFAN